VRRAFGFGVWRCALLHARRIYRFVNTAESVPAARRAVSNTLQAWEYGDDVVETARLFVSELAANAVQHAAESLTFTVLCWLENGFMTIGVIDSVSQKLPRRVKAAADDANGRGLALIETLAADFGCEPCPTGKIVFARLHVTEPPIHVYLRELAGTGQQCFT
jgi:anti-sigma regulatory factor (Ser/Thr protein kinase)